MKIIFILILSIITNTLVFSQSKWKRSEEIVELPTTIFKSSEALNMQTAELIPQNDLVYGISHRFSGPVSDGYSTFFGLDNGAFMRMFLAYGINEKLMVSLGRTNYQAAVDLQAKYKIYHSKVTNIPIMLSGNIGLSHIGKSQIKIKETSKEFQAFASLIFNTLLFDRLAIGINPSYLNNTIPTCDCSTESYILGSYIQYYFNDDMTSIILESVNTLKGWRGDGSSPYYDTYSLGVEFETGGHYFKLMLSNNNLINQSQVFNGASVPFSLKNLKFGFQITRNFGI